MAALVAATSLTSCGSSGAGRASVPSTAAAQPTATPDEPGFSATSSSRGCGATVRWAGSSGGVGVIFGAFSITAVPGHVCRFRGRPAITLLDQAGQARPTRAARDTLVTPPADYRKTVEVRDGHPASFSVVYSHGLPSGRACRRAFGAEVQLPPSHVRYRVPVSPRGGPDDHHAFNPCGGAVAVTAIRLDAAG